MHFYKKIIIYTLFANFQAYASSIHHPFYLGVLGGYASTTWKGLVPENNNQSVALNMSTPIKVNEGGPIVGVATGLEIGSNFAIEGSYFTLHDAVIKYDPQSLYAFSHDGAIQFESTTQAVNIMGKLLIPFPNDAFRLMSGAGIADVHREDDIMDQWRLAPSFSVGLNYRFSPRLMGEFVGNYTAGYGESQLNPAEAYFPFLYSVSLRLLFCFG